MNAFVKRVVRGESPFTRLIAFGVFDGPTSGVVELGGNGESALFDLLAWDDAQRQRVFGLAPLAVEGVELLPHLRSKYAGTNDREVWLPFLPDEQDRADLASMIARIRDASGAPSHVVVAANLLGLLTAVREIESDVEREEYRRLSKRTSADAEVSDSSFDDWNRFINVNAGGVSRPGVH